MSATLPRRATLLLALLFGVLAAAWRPLPTQTGRDGLATTDGVVLAIAGKGHGQWCAPHLSDRVPMGHRSPSWHGGAGRRNTRSAGCSPLIPPAGSILALDPFIRQHVTSFVRNTLPLQNTGRSAVAPRPPPAVN